MLNWIHFRYNATYFHNNPLDTAEGKLLNQRASNGLEHKLDNCLDQDLHMSHMTHGMDNSVHSHLQSSWEDSGWHKYCPICNESKRHIVLGLFQSNLGDHTQGHSCEWHVCLQTGLADGFLLLQERLSHLLKRQPAKDKFTRIIISDFCSIGDWTAEFGTLISACWDIDFFIETLF